MIYTLNLSNCNINSIGYVYKTVNIQNHELVSGISFFPHSTRLQMKNPLLPHWRATSSLLQRMTLSLFVFLSSLRITINYDGSKVVSGDTNGDLFVHLFLQWSSLDLGYYQHEVNQVCTSLHLCNHQSSIHNQAYKFVTRYCIVILYSFCRWWAIISYCSFKEISY